MHANSHFTSRLVLVCFCAFGCCQSNMIHSTVCQLIPNYMVTFNIIFDKENIMNDSDGKAGFGIFPMAFDAFPSSGNLYPAHSSCNSKMVGENWKWVFMLWKWKVNFHLKTEINYDREELKVFNVTYVMVLMWFQR